MIQQFVLKELSDLNKEKDLRIIKILHDIQNPVMSINLSLDNQEQTLNSNGTPEDNMLILPSQITANSDQTPASNLNLVKNQIISEVDALQNTLNSIKYEMKVQRNISHNESLKVISTNRFLNKIIKQNIKLASNGDNKIRLIIKAEEIQNKINIRRQTVDLLVCNILKLNFKNLTKGIVRIKISKDDFDIKNQDEQMICAGSQRDDNMLQFMIEIDNSQMKLDLYDQTLMDVFTFNTFIQLCRNSDIFLKYRSTFEQCKLQIPFKNTHDMTYINKDVDQIYQRDKLEELNQNNNNHVCNTAIIVEDNNNILKHQGKMMESRNINHVLFLNGQDALDQISTIKCDKRCKILVYTDFNMPQLDGCQLAFQLRKLNMGHQFKIILISAEDNYQNNHSNIFDEIYMKPITKFNLIQIQNEQQNEEEINEDIALNDQNYHEEINLDIESYKIENK